MTVSPAVHFLLVEDDDDQAELVQLAFEDQPTHHSLDRVGDGESALAYLRREGPFVEARRPDVVLLDLRLPRMDGHEVLRSIKSDRSLRRIPVVVLTTSTAPSDKARAYELHVNSYLMKPDGFDRFQSMISDLHRYWSQWNEGSQGELESAERAG
ncbi:MAG: response regulator [Phycisphaerales bacterium]|nr:response regulator [Phycisphaerae bacterium]NNF44133.1 response regulator [Phycisphaerales bacterium]NNM26342.1 response regulator [Phycisphaerales bacterium]